VSNTTDAAQSVTADLVVRCGWLVTCGPEGVLRNAELAVKNGRILAVGRGQKVEARTVLDRRDHIVFPGLVNTHAHLYQNLLKGIGHDLPLARWNREAIAPAAAHLTEEDCYIAALSGCVESLLGGTTTLVEFMHNHPRPRLSDSIISAARETGIRLIFGRGYRDRAREPVFENMAEPVERSLEDVQRLMSTFPPDDDGLLRFALAPAGIRTGVSKHGLAQTAAFAVENDLPVTMHVLETAADDECSRELYGSTTTELLEHVGLLRPRFVAVHCCAASPEDVARLARSGAAISHNPASNMILASGVCPVPAFLDAGATVALGTDGAASNNTLDMLETIKLTGLLHKMQARNPAIVTAEALLLAATLGGARALGREAELGSLESGKRADFVVYDPYVARSAAVHDPVATLVYSAGREGICDVAVGGRLMVCDHRLVRHNERDVSRRVQAQAGELQRRMHLPTAMEARNPVQ
jgi:5-methylthioadenosine/S-adenosylhomocysteine deaminase